MTKRPDNIALLFFFSAGIVTALMSYSSLFFIIFHVFALILFFVFRLSRLPVIIFFTGSFIFVLHNNSQFRVREMMSDMEEKEAVVYGRISKVDQYLLSSSVVVNSDSVKISGRTVLLRSRFSAYLNRTGLSIGDTVTVSGKIKPFKKPLNKYEVDRKKFSIIGYTVSGLSNASLTGLRKNEAGMIYFINRLQSGAENIFDRRLSYTAGGFLTAIMTGDKSRLENNRINEFADSGTIHLLAVSGLHVGFVVLLLGILNSFLHLKKWPYVILNSSVLIFYAVFTGGSPSVIRAVLMAVILMMSKPLKRKLRALDIIGTAGLISLSYDPNQLFMPGFILSFAAVLSIVLIHQPLSVKLNKYIRTESRILRKIYEGLLLSASVTIGLLPFVLYFFGRYNFISILSNLILIPLTAAAFMSGILILAADKVHLAAAFSADITEFIISTIMYITKSTAGLELFTLHGNIDVLVTLSLVFVISGFFYFKNYRYKTLLTSISVLIIGISIFLIESDPVLYVFKTSSGQAAVLINCGENILFADGIKRSEITGVIQPYLTRSNIRKIDYLITESEWYETEEIINYLHIPVKNIVGGMDNELIPGDHECLDFISLNGVLRTARSKIRSQGDTYIINSAGHSYILGSNDKDRGYKIVFSNDHFAAFFD